jgi:vancomycin permeability regulator SanA
MTISAADSPRSDTSRARLPGRRTRAALWLLHITVLALAVGSIVTTRFDLWIDLRMLGTSAIVVKLAWVLAGVLVPFFAGPRLGGWWRHPRWTHAGVAPHLAWYLLWPTYLVMACLLVNTVYYGWLYGQLRVDFMTPMPLVILLVLAAWVLLTRHWLRHLTHLPTVARTTRGAQLVAALLATPILLVIAGGFLLHLFSRPPTGKVDLAVVLGNAVRRDGQASTELTERTRAAIELYRQGLVKHLFLSGGVHPPLYPGDPPQNEVAAMERLCLDAGIPADALTLDPVGVNTKATAINARLFMQQHGYHSVVACTSEFHMYRATTSFQQYGIAAYTQPGQKLDWICPSPAGLLRELVGVTVYQLFPHYREPKAFTMQLAAPRVLVRKAANVLELYDGPKLVQTYACITGGGAGDKAVEGDHKTPEGLFHIVFKNPQSQYHLSLGLDYPNREDAQRGLTEKKITREQYDGILEALQSDLSRVENQQKLWYTPLGGEIFLHGHGEGRTNTAGCVALSNSDIEELYAILPVGTPVEIRP